MRERTHRKVIHALRGLKEGRYKWNKLRIIRNEKKEMSELSEKDKNNSCKKWIR